jgi:hypothetical protein
VKKGHLILLFVMLAAMLFSIDAEAQCSMCQAVVETNMRNNEKTFGLGLNNAILYLMSVPYILLAVVGYLFYRKLKANG